MTIWGMDHPPHLYLARSLNCTPAGACVSQDFGQRASTPFARAPFQFFLADLWLQWFVLLKIEGRQKAAENLSVLVQQFGWLGEAAKLAAHGGINDDLGHGTALPSRYVMPAALAAGVAPF